MNLEFLDTNIVVYAHSGNAGRKQVVAADLIGRLVESGNAAMSVQVLAEFYSTATRKLHLTSEAAGAIIADFGTVTIHRLAHVDLLRAAHLQRQHKISWWDALIVTSALELGCTVLWSEDLKHSQTFGFLSVRNPFR